MSKPVLILRHVPHESAGTLENALATAHLEFQYLDLFHEYPGSLDCGQYLGLVVLGGPMNVDEVQKHPFLGDDIRWIRQTVEAGIPMLGICLGSQLLAKAFGARVYPGRIKEIGWYPLELTIAAAEDRLFAGCGPNLTVFQWHGDTFDLPPGAVHLAQSPLCRNQAFRIGPSAYGLQFHIEMTVEMIEDWLTESGNRGELASLDYIDAKLIRQKTPQDLPGLQTLADKVLGRFAELCRERI
ncbi:MAG: gamma-glutamyl-gamma-aminobutyrate hydrolase family protein [Thermoguttaceae bacterium]|jgi:GMP synthase (glutamine-hydrolysing)